MATRGDWNEFRRRIDDAAMVLLGLVSRSIGEATEAILDGDSELAGEVITAHEGIVTRSEELTGLIKERLSVSMLDPDELEYLVAVIQLIPDIERGAGHAEHIARRTLDDLGARVDERSRELIAALGDVVARMWASVMEAYRRRVRDADFAVTDAGAEVQELAHKLIDRETGDGADAELAVDLALVARFYERLADHASSLHHRIEIIDAPRRMIRLPFRDSPVPTEGRPGPEKPGPLRRIVGFFARFRVGPRDDAFMQLFRAAADNARVCADALATVVASTNGFDAEAFERVRECENRGDEITVDLLRHLDASFVTPYDREDIHALAEELDDVVDDMFIAGSRLQLVDGDPELPQLGEFAEVIIEMTDEMRELMDCLEVRDGARFRLERIDHLERRADAIFQRGLVQLFDGGYEAIEVIKLKDILESLEGACNAIEDVSDVVESILVKTS